MFEKLKTLTPIKAKHWYNFDNKAQNLITSEGAIDALLINWKSLKEIRLSKV